MCRTLSVLVSAVYEISTSPWKACSFSFKFHIEITVASFTKNWIVPLTVLKVLVKFFFSAVDYRTQAPNIGKMSIIKMLIRPCAPRSPFVSTLYHLPPPSVTSLFFYFPLSSNSFSSGFISMWLPYLSSHYASPLFFSPVLSPSLFWRICSNETK